MGILNYEFTGETKKIQHSSIKENRLITLHRIVAINDLKQHLVKKGDLGGWIEKESNLQGNAWVGNEAMVFDNAMVFGNAIVYEDATVYGDSKIYGKAKVYGNSFIRDKATVCGESSVTGISFISDFSKIDGCAYCKNCSINGNSYIFGKSNLNGNVQTFGYAYIGSDNDFCVLSKFGSVNRDITFFRNINKKIFVNCGCFQGTLDEFVQQVKKTHRRTKYEKEYLTMVELIKIKFNTD